MTTFTLPEVAPVEKDRARRVPVSPVSFRRVAASEWVKLTTLRSTWIVFSCVRRTVAECAASGLGVVWRGIWRVARRRAKS
jgi:hypothetical protein